MSYTIWSSSEKKQYSKQFSKRDRVIYRRGKRNGWLDCYHKYVKNNKRTRSAWNYTERHQYSNKQIFDDPANYEF